MGIALSQGLGFVAPVIHRYLKLTERKHGLSTQQFPVSAYVGSSKNLKDLKDGGSTFALGRPTLDLYLSEQRSPPGRARVGGP